MVPADPVSDHLPDLTAVETAHRVRSGELTARQAVAAALDRIEALDPPVNAFVTVLAEQALAEADAVDADPVRRSGPLAGVPIAIKDVLDVAGVVTNHGSSGYDVPAPRDCAAVRRVREAGAVVVGTTTMSEFGALPFTESERFGATHNPWDLTRTPGGSSGGSAAAVAARMVPLALGTDGGGSLRIPAAPCGIIGLKPPRGRVSQDPRRELMLGMGVIGPMARSVEDVALTHDLIAGTLPIDRDHCPPPPEPLLATVRRHRRTPVGEGQDGPPLHVIRLALPGTNEQIRDAAWAGADALAARGHQVHPADREVTAHLMTALSIFMPHFYVDLRELIEDAPRKGHHVEQATRLSATTGVWARQWHLAWARRAREQFANRLERLLGDRLPIGHPKRVDAILMPTVMALPIEAGRVVEYDGVRRQVASLPFILSTLPFNVSGHASIGMPSGLSREGWPMGLQIVAPRGREDAMIRLAVELEEALPALPAPPHSADFPRSPASA